MASRRLRKHLATLCQAPGGDSPEVLAALEVLIASGTAPGTAAGAEAAEVWERSAAFDEEPVWRRLWCHIQITGMSVADYLRQAEEGDESHGDQGDDGR